MLLTAEGLLAHDRALRSRGLQIYFLLQVGPDLFNVQEVGPMPCSRPSKQLSLPLKPGLRRSSRAKDWFARMRAACA